MKKKKKLTWLTSEPTAENTLRSSESNRTRSIQIVLTRKDEKHYKLFFISNCFASKLRTNRRGLTSKWVSSSFSLQFFICLNANLNSTKQKLVFHFFFFGGAA